MLRALPIFALFCLCPAWAAEENEPAPTTPPAPIQRNQDAHVISSSHVFSVSGSDGLRVGAIASRADDMRTLLCKVLDIPKKKKRNISIRLLGKTSDARVFPRMRQQIDIIGNEPSFTLLVQAGGGVDVPELNKAIITISLYEYALRDVDLSAIEGNIAIPEWLLVGVQQAALWRNGKIERSTYEQLFKRAEMLSPEQIIGNEHPEELDGASRDIYEASCGVLILGLLGQEGGAARLQNMLQEAVLQEGSMLTTLKQHFHEVGLSGNALAKWWALELANLAIPKTTEVMTPLETEERLAEALRFTYYDPETKVPSIVSFDDVYAIVKLDDWKTQIDPIPMALSAMSVRCFPTYRPFILEYIRAMNLLLINEDPDEVQGIIGPLREMREAYVVSSLRVRDYLDWYEITHTGRSNQAAFTSYLDTMAMLRNEQHSTPNPISNYLRDIEELYKLKHDELLPQSLRQEIKQAQTKP